MIYDRTQEHVDKAIELRDSKVKTFSELTQDEIDILERGTLTINTINRIESKQEEIKNLLAEIGYYVDIENKTWDYSDVFTEDEFKRIIDNDDKLKKAFFTYSTTPKTPEASYHYEVINSIEKILVDLDVMINDVKNYYRQCGTFNCGEE